MSENNNYVVFPDNQKNKDLVYYFIRSYSKYCYSNDKENISKIIDTYDDFEWKYFLIDDNLKDKKSFKDVYSPFVAISNYFIVYGHVSFDLNDLESSLNATSIMFLNDNSLSCSIDNYAINISNNSSKIMFDCLEYDANTQYIYEYKNVIDYINKTKNNLLNKNGKDKEFKDYSYHLNKNNIGIFISVFITLGVLMLAINASFFSHNSESKQETSQQSYNASDEAIKSFKKDRLDNGVSLFIFYGDGNWSDLDASLMKNDDDDSYDFTIRESGDDRDIATFYVAKIYSKNSSQYQYAISLSDVYNDDEQTLLNQDLQQNVMFVINNNDSRNPFQITIGEFEDIFNMSPDTDFKLSAN